MSPFAHLGQTLECSRACVALYQEGAPHHGKPPPGKVKFSLPLGITMTGYSKLKAYRPNHLPMLRQNLAQVGPE